MGGLLLSRGAITGAQLLTFVLYVETVDAASLVRLHLLILWLVENERFIPPVCGSRYVPGDGGCGLPGACFFNVFYQARVHCLYFALQCTVSCAGSLFLWNTVASAACPLQLTQRRPDHPPKPLESLIGNFLLKTTHKNRQAVCDQWGPFMEAIGASERILGYLDRPLAPQLAPGRSPPAMAGLIQLQGVCFR